MYQKKPTRLRRSWRINKVRFGMMYRNALGIVGHLSIFVKIFGNFGFYFTLILALLIHHKIYQLPKEKKMISKYSIRDFIEYLANIKIVRINDQWILDPIIRKQENLLRDLKNLLRKKSYGLRKLLLYFSKKVESNHQPYLFRICYFSLFDCLSASIKHQVFTANFGFIPCFSTFCNDCSFFYLFTFQSCLNCRRKCRKCYFFFDF